MSAHSSIVGGSTASRLLACPGSWQATLALPETADTASEYAAEGTAMHEVMATLMRTRQLEPGANLYDYGWSLLGHLMHDRIFTSEHYETMVEPTLQHLEALELEYGGNFQVFGVEKSVKFPGISGAFGTIDLLLGSDTHVLHVDWKFGQGIGVQAVYTDPAGDTVNGQLMFYVTAAKSSARHLYRDNRQLVAAIIQPRGEVPLSHTVITRNEVKYFAQDLVRAVALATSRDPVRVRGEHCRFAPCKINCPLWTGPLLDLSALGKVPQARTDTVSREPTPYGEYLARAKALVDGMAMFKKELDEQLHAYLEDGGVVPGWRLKPKAKQRQWADERLVEKTLRDLGFDTPEIWQTKLQTFASIDATARRRGVPIPDNLRIMPPTNETTIATTDDPAPVVERQLAIEQFSAALKLLQNG
jgi:hypothetical protein